MLVVVALLIVASFIAGALMSLFGPDEGRWLGVFAFLTTVVLLPFLEGRRKAGKLRRVASTDRYCHILWIFMFVCCALCICSLLGLFLSAQDGVADGSSAVFAEQEQYRLSNHGKYTNVTRARYLVVGSSFVIAWHAFGTIFSLFTLHLVLFGKWPPMLDSGK